MSKHKSKCRWYGYIRNILNAYPNVEERERDAVDAAIMETVRMEDGEARLSIIELVFFIKCHTLEGAAQAVHYSYHQAQRKQLAFFQMVGKYLNLP
jgi:hypothetical protein